MSERNRGSITNGTHHEGHDLADLHASRTSEALRHAPTEPSNTDLSSASIQSISVVRLSARPEKRKLSSLNVPTPPELEPAAEHPPRQRSEPKRAESHGILKNPYFPYKGNLLERFITLLANILKYLERSLLTAQRPLVPQPQPQKPARMAKKRDTAGREVADEKDPSTEGETSLKSSSR